MFTQNVRWRCRERELSACENSLLLARIIFASLFCSSVRHENMNTRATVLHILVLSFLLLTLHFMCLHNVSISYFPLHLHFMFAIKRKRVNVSTQTTANVCFVHYCKCTYVCTSLWFYI